MTMTKQMYSNYPIVFHVSQTDKESNQSNLLHLIKKSDSQLNMKHEAILTFPFFSHGGKLTAILTKSDTFF